MIVIPTAVVGALMATFGLSIFRGYRRSPAAYILVGVTALELVVPVAALFMVRPDVKS